MRNAIAIAVALVLAAVAGALPGRAAPEPALDCHTLESVRADIFAQAPDATPTVFRGIGATSAFVAALLSDGGTPPTPIPQLIAIEAFDPGEGGQIMLRFFGLDGCDIGLGAYISLQRFNSIQAAVGLSV